MLRKAREKSVTFEGIRELLTRNDVQKPFQHPFTSEKSPLGYPGAEGFLH